MKPREIAGANHKQKNELTHKLFQAVGELSCRVAAPISSRVLADTIHPGEFKQNLTQSFASRSQSLKTNSGVFNNAHNKSSMACFRVTSF